MHEDIRVQKIIFIIIKIDTGGQTYNVASSAVGNTALGFGIAGVYND